MGLCVWTMILRGHIYGCTDLWGFYVLCGVFPTTVTIGGEPAGEKAQKTELFDTDVNACIRPGSQKVSLVALTPHPDI